MEKKEIGACAAAPLVLARGGATLMPARNRVALVPDAWCGESKEI